MASNFTAQTSRAVLFLQTTCAEKTRLSPKNQLNRIQPLGRLDLNFPDI